MIRTRSLIAAASGVILAMAPAPFAALAAPTTGDAQIAVVTPLSFIQVENLEFGRIIPAATPSTVTISTTNMRTATGGAVPVGTDYNVARFAGMGAVGLRVRIRITPSTITLTGPGPAMTVNNFQIGPAPSLQQIGASPNYRIMPLNGIFWFTVGGRLNIGASQPSGHYSGTFNATLDYP